MILPFLADQEVTDLTKYGYPDVIVAWRPMDLTDKAKWADKCRQAGCSVISAEGRTIGLRQQIISIANLELLEPDKSKHAYEDKYFNRLPLGFLTPVWDDIESKSSLSETEIKNSEGPSASATTSDTAPLIVEPVQSGNETSSAAS